MGSTRGKKLVAVNMGNTLGRKLVAVNEFGQRVGESHPRARLSDADVDQMFAMRERGDTVRAVARHFGIAWQYASKVLNYRARNQLAVRWVRHRLTPGDRR